MRSSFLVASLAALAAAQSIDFSQVSGAPPVTTTAAPVTGTSESVSAQSPGAQSTIGSAAIQASPIAQRGISPLEKRDGDCSTQPAGTGPTVNFPDTPEAFLKFPYFKAAAYSAPIPRGYALNFTNFHASTSTSSYMGYTNLNQYDTQQCADLCTKQTGCQAFNLYFERDPTLDPNAQACPNPPSLTNIKCVFWGVPVSAATATNSGQYRDSFQVVIAGQYSFEAQTVITLLHHHILIQDGLGQFPGREHQTAPMIPRGGYSTFIGSKYFSFGLLPGQVQYFNTEVCIAACGAETAYNSGHPKGDGSKPKICNHVVSHMLTDNFGVPQGVYCAFYTESWDPSYGTITQSEYQGAQWTAGYAYGYTNATYAVKYPPIKRGGYSGGNCGGWGAGNC